MKLFFITGVIAGFFAFAVNDVETELVALEELMAASVLVADIPTLEKMYSDDFLFTHGTGEVQTKEQWLAGLENGSPSWTERKVDSIKVEVHGNVAVTTGRIYAQTRSDDPLWQEYLIWYVRTYRLHGESWKLLSHKTIKVMNGPLNEQERPENK